MAAVEASVATAATRRALEYCLIDSDIHSVLPSRAALDPYLPERWRRYHERFGPRRPSQRDYWVTSTHPQAARADAYPPSGLPPGADLDFMRLQLLDEWGIEYGILNGTEALDFGHERGGYGAALTRALNEHTVHYWLDQEPRLRSAISVTPDNAPAAVAEIERCAPDTRFVQVLFPLRNDAPMGHRLYWPIYRAATDAGLPIAVHVGGTSGQQPSGAGWFSYWYELHVGHIQVVEAHAASLALSGVFDELPGLRVVFVEAGFSWSVPLSWRLDRMWSVMREEVPDLQRRPSEYVRDHLWFTTQPSEEPDRFEQFHAMVDALDLGERLMFATDYPHWDFDAPDRALPRGLGEQALRKIYSENARAFYRLPPREASA